MPTTTATAPGSTAQGHRQRLLTALAAAMTTRPFAEITVADIVREARTSRRTFYEHFSDKTDCLSALLNESHQRIIAAISTAVDADQPWQSQVRQGIAAWITSVQAEPEVTLSWIRIVPALGPEARVHMTATMAEYAALIRDLIGRANQSLTEVPAPSDQEIVMLLGALRELIATTVEDGGDVGALVDVATDFTLRVATPRAPAPSLER